MMSSEMNTTLIERSNRTATLLRSPELVRQFGLEPEQVEAMLRWIQNGDQACACGNVGPNVCTPVNETSNS